MHLTLSPPPSSFNDAADSAAARLVHHLDDVYRVARVLTGDRLRAGDLTEAVFRDARDDDAVTTLDAQTVRDRLLSRCIAMFSAHDDLTRSDASAPPPAFQASRDRLDTLLLALPLTQRAAIALVDQLGLSYADAAAILGSHVAELRSHLHAGRAVLFAAYHVGAR